MENNFWGGPNVNRTQETSPLYSQLRTSKSVRVFSKFLLEKEDIITYRFIAFRLCVVHNGPAIATHWRIED